MSRKEKPCNNNNEKNVEIHYNMKQRLTLQPRKSTQSKDSVADNTKITISAQKGGKKQQQQPKELVKNQPQ